MSIVNNTTHTQCCRLVVISSFITSQATLLVTVTMQSYDRTAAHLGFFLDVFVTAACVFVVADSL